MYNIINIILVKVFRDGRWNEEDVAILVPGYIISIKLGDIVPADARVLEGDPLKIDQSSLTGESLYVTKGPGDGVYSGSTCKQEEIDAVVIATGVHTFFGKAAYLVDSTNQVLTAIGNFCICSIAVRMVVEIIVQYPIQDRKYHPGIENLPMLLIGGIPIAIPTVLSVTMAIGAHRLAQQGAITKRMTAIEEMAGMDVLCSDKTGTLTLNKLTVDKNMIEVFAKGIDADVVVLMAARASRTENQDAIDTAIVGMLADPKEAHIYSAKGGDCAAFLSNYDSKYAARVLFNDKHYNLPPWSIGILPDCHNVVFNTAKVGVQTSKMEILSSNVDINSWETYNEDISSMEDSSAFTTSGLLEQINVTRDASDYLWYITR
ncbi:hypothetical protein AgCh_006222 [Apium graveolens]